MDLSIVIPVYNVEKYLVECLKTLPLNAKIILINDGSTDGSEEILKHYISSNSNAILVNKQNGGLSDARNTGIKYVRTKYTLYLDSDDYISSMDLESAYNFALKNDLDWLQCGYAYKYETCLKNLTSIKKPQILDKDSVMKDLIQNGYIKNFAWGKIYKTELIKDIPFPKGKYYEDSFWQYKIIDRSSRFGIFPELVTFYRQRSTSISGDFNVRLLDLLEGLEERLSFLLDKNEYRDLGMQAALNLWNLSEDFKEIAVKKYPNIINLFNEKSKKIKNNYSTEIISAINTQHLLNKYRDKARYRNAYIIYRIIKYFLRISSRFSS